MSSRRVTIDEQYLEGAADGIRYANGTNNKYKPSQFEEAIRALKMTLQSKTATSNGVITPDSGYNGLSQVTVDVLTPQPNLQSKTATENGTVLPDSGYDGLSSVIVDVPSGGGINLYSWATPAVSGFMSVTVQASEVQS